MPDLSPVILIIILVVCVIIALLIGYFLGSRLGGKKSSAMRQAQEEHAGYKDDVREHFEQTSAIMARMVEDYRDMYKHMSEGAAKLADIHPERQITPPPEPEAITRDSRGASGGEGARHSLDASSDTSAKRGHGVDAVMRSDSSNDRPWNKESGSKKYGLE